MSDVPPKPSAIAPWLRGIIDTLVGARLICQSAIPHRNRLAVILLDSAFETSCRAYLKHKAKITLTDSHKHRENLVSTIKSKLGDIDEPVWENIDYYYMEIRLDFYHQSAGKTITDVQLLEYQEAIEFVISKAFSTRVDEIANNELQQLEKNTGPIIDSVSTTPVIAVRDVGDKVSKILIAVATIHPKTVDEINDFFKKEGDSLRLKKDDFLNVVARHSGSKKLFYYDRQNRSWEISGTGKFKLSQLQGEP
jgi:hypothetical protein